MALDGEFDKVRLMDYLHKHKNEFYGKIVDEETGEVKEMQVINFNNIEMFNNPEGMKAMYNLLKNKIMNKKSFLALSFAAIAIVSGYAGVKAFRSQANGENDLLAQNIEALSEDEGQEKLYETYMRPSARQRE